MIWYFVGSLAMGLIIKTGAKTLSSTPAKRENSSGIWQREHS
jgi:hypothetical protein